MVGGPSRVAATSARRTAAAQRAASVARSDGEAQLLAALLALVDGEALDPSEERELLLEGLVTRGSLAHGVQLTLRGNQMVEACTAGDFWPATEGRSDQ